WGELPQEKIQGTWDRFSDPPVFALQKGVPGIMKTSHKQNRTSVLLSAVGVVLVGAMSVGCGDEGDELDDSTVDDAELRAGQYTADELFWELKEIESAFPQVAESCTIEVGTLNGSTGEFTGLVTIPGYYDYEFGRYFPPIKPARNCNAVNAKLRYRVINNSGSFRVTVDGDTTYDDGGNGIIDVDIGRDKEVSWTARSGTKAFS